jgi:hypothetical protein
MAKIARENGELYDDGVEEIMPMDGESPRKIRSVEETLKEIGAKEIPAKQKE